MEGVWNQVFFCWVILGSVFNEGYCERTCQTLDDCYSSTEFSQFYYKTYLDPASVNYNPRYICEKSNPVKMWCYDKCKYILQEDAICGQVISEEIIIGPMTRINEFPWVALLQYTDGKTIETSCQGVLITNEYVMTSATCLSRNTNGFNLTSVRLGEWDKTTVIDLRRNFYPGKKFEIASWGERFLGGRKSEILLKVDLEAVACQSNSDISLCIQGTRNRNVCDGDEGAPIMGRTTLRNRTLVYLAGIVSKNNSCGANDGQIFLVDKVDWIV